jgi:ferritin-like protein
MAPLHFDDRNLFMAQSAGFHEDTALLSAATMDQHRAIVSLQEELEAVDWYDQRVSAANDPELKQILAHNRDEEKEHAAMVLEWLRRRDPALDDNLRTYLWTTLPVTEVEDAAMAAGGSGAGNGAGSDDGAGGSLRIGSLRGVAQ